MGGPASFKAVHIVWRWPLKRNGFNWHGGRTDWVREGSVILVPDFDGRVTGEGWWVYVVLEWPSDNILGLAFS